MLMDIIFKKEVIYNCNNIIHIKTSMIWIFKYDKSDI